MSTKKLTIIWVIVAVAALAGGFLWGKSIGGSTTTAASRTGAGRFALGSSTAAFAGRGGFSGAGSAGVGFTAGQVLSINSDSLTLQLANGNSENVFFSSSTEVIVPQPAPISSIQSGTMVMVTGTTNSDGSVTASTIELRGNTGNTTQ